MNNPTIALIDIDQIIYAVASMAENKDMPDSHILQAAKQMLHNREKEVRILCPTVDKVRLFISDAHNFRRWLDPTYKGNRPPKPQAYMLVREYMEHKGAECKPFLEADDVTAMIHSWSHVSGKYNTVLVDQDKDLDQVAGHRIVPSLRRGGVVVREAEYKVITELEGWKSFYQQLLKGDSTDAIEGINGTQPFVKEAKKLIEASDSKEDMYILVLNAYEENFNYLEVHEIVAIIMRRAQMLYMKRFPNDVWLPPIYNNIVR